MTNFITDKLQSVNNGHIFTVPVARRIKIGISDALGLKVAPNDPNTKIFIWKELSPQGNNRWFQVTGFQSGNVIVEAKRNINVLSHIQIAVQPLHRRPWVINFLNQTLYTALEASCNKNISLSALLGHAAHESQWGKSTVCQTYNAWFGVTARSGTPNTVTLRNGRTIRRYSNFQDSLNDYLRFVETTYRGAWAVRGNTDSYINSLGRVYDPATKNTYPVIWRNLLRDGNLQELDNLRDSC
jgi:hypothetical protein